jgi:hypothetical protein
VAALGIAGGFALACLLAPPAAAETAPADTALAIVVGAGFEGVDEISLPVLRQLYLGRRTRLEGQRVRPLHLPAGSPARNAFTRAVIGTSERAMERYWLREALSGGPAPPRELEVDEALAFVAREPGALAYLEWPLRGREPPAGVRILPIALDGRRVLPGEPGYPLRLPAPRPAS